MKTAVPVDTNLNKPYQSVKLTDDAGVGNSTAFDKLEVFVNDRPVADGHN